MSVRGPALRVTSGFFHHKEVSHEKDSYLGSSGATGGGMLSHNTRNMGDIFVMMR